MSSYPAESRLRMLKERVTTWSQDVLQQVQLDDRIDQKKVDAFKNAVKGLLDATQILKDEISAKRRG